MPRAWTRRSPRCWRSIHRRRFSLPTRTASSLRCLPPFRSRATPCCGLAREWTCSFQAIARDCSRPGIGFWLPDLPAARFIWPAIPRPRSCIAGSMFARPTASILAVVIPVDPAERPGPSGARSAAQAAPRFARINKGDAGFIMTDRRGGHADTRLDGGRNGRSCVQSSSSIPRIMHSRSTTGWRCSYLRGSDAGCACAIVAGTIRGCGLRSLTTICSSDPDLPLCGVRDGRHLGGDGARAAPGTAGRNGAGRALSGGREPSDRLYQRPAPQDRRCRACDERGGADGDGRSRPIVRPSRARSTRCSSARRGRRSRGANCRLPAGGEHEVLHGQACGRSTR